MDTSNNCNINSLKNMIHQPLVAMPIQELILQNSMLLSLLFINQTCCPFTKITTIHINELGLDH